jgi:alpha-2-macroglobulin
MLVLMAVVVALLPAPGYARQPAPVVVFFSPQGTVKQVRQVTARFSEPMVPLGDPRVNANVFAIDCPGAPGKARWIDSGTWSYDFDHELPAGVRCTFTLRAGLKSLRGAAFSGQPQFTFDTGGPSIVDSRPWPDSTDIDESQAFVLVLDAQADPQSILEHAYFAVEGIPQMVGATIMGGAGRDLLLKRFKNLVNQRPVVILQARQQFPDKAGVKLIWGKGIRTTTGIATIQDQEFNYKVRKAFEARFSCEREIPKGPCIPLTPMTVSFSWQVSADQARRVTLLGPDGKPRPAKLGHEQEVSSVSFDGPFAESAQYTVEVPHDIVDETGRALANPSRFPLAVRTDEFPPLAKFSARFGIIEQADPVLPLTVRNLEPEIHGAKLDLHGAAAVSGSSLYGLLSHIEATYWRLPPPTAATVMSWMQKVAQANRDQSVFGAGPGAGAKTFTLPKPNGAKAFEVMGIPLKDPGLYIVELSSAKLGSVLLGGNQRMYVPTMALVTGLAVHFKQGNDNSLVWVTSLEKAEPVQGAAVTIADCNGAELWTGRTDHRGIALVPKITAFSHLPDCSAQNNVNTDKNPDYYSTQNDALRAASQELIVTASYGGDFSFDRTGWQNGIETFRFNLPSEFQPANVAATTVLDRTLFRAGETVHMKHFIRAKTIAGFEMLAPEKLPDSMRINLVGGEDTYDFKLAWRDNGTAESTWDIPKAAKLGSYSITLVRHNKNGPTPTPSTDQGGGGDTTEYAAGFFRVEEFRVPLMKAAIRLPAAPLIRATAIPVDVSVAYLAGGPAKGLPVTLRSQITNNAMPAFPDYDRFTFVNGPVKEGVVKSEEWEETGEQAAPGVHQRTALVLDAAGGAQAQITGIAPAQTPTSVQAELEYRDPNGEAQTVSNSVTIWPSKLLVGIYGGEWTSSSGVRVHLAVVDQQGKPAAGAPVAVTLFSHRTFSYRKRLIGGFYAYENTVETKGAGQLCAGRTDARGLLTCNAKPAVTGSVLVQGAVTDANGNVSYANCEIYIPGPGEQWFGGQDTDRMDVLPERTHYEPGETARVQVRMPFSEATVLVTIEREGILAASVFPLSGKDPVIRVPIQDYAPNVFVSVLAVRGRIGSIQPTAMVDLGKPAFKLGIAEIRVGWRDHELKVAVTADRPVYHVREKAHVKIAVKTASGAQLPAGAEVAVAAVDQGLLELSPNGSWKLLDAMMGERSYQVQTSTAQMQVVGKRHYGLKALPPGGGGGRQATRQLFNTLLLWKAVVALDDRGEAEVDVPLNDSLTSFKIVAIASAGDGLFGTGSTSIRSTQDLMLFAGVSPMIRTGDAFDAMFTVRNASERAFEARVSTRVDGLAAPQLQVQKVQLGPGDGKTISWLINVPTGVAQLKYHVDATTAAGGPSDHLLITQSVVAAVPVRTYQATLLRWEKPIEQPIARPADALPGEGGVAVTLSPSLVAGLDGVRQWMRDYPYSCLEQRVSRAVALNDPKLWQGIVGDLPSYTDPDGLLKYFPSMDQGSDVLTAYFLALTNEAGLEIPSGSLDKIEQGLSGFVEGKIVRREAISTVDLPLRKLAAIEALARVDKAKPEMLATITIDPNLWPDSAVIDWWSILLRIKTVPQRTDRLAAAEQIMRARLNWQGTSAHLSGGDLWWLMTGPSTNQMRLVLVALDNSLWADDLPKVMAGAMALQSQGAWSTTTANAWGTLAAGKFAHAFESKAVTGTTTAAIEAAKKQLAWATDLKGGTLDFSWPPGPADLRVDHSGGGNPWVQVRANAAIPLKSPLSSGYQITKTLTPVESTHSGGWRQGDLVRVHLKIEAQTDMTWVVVNDPIPAGASHLGTGLGRDSQIATANENLNNESYVWPAFIERAFEGLRAYYDYVPKGTFEIEYTIRLNQAGTFQLPATRVEPLYEPEMFGESPNPPFVVAP